MIAARRLLATRGGATPSFAARAAAARSLDDTPLRRLLSATTAPRAERHRSNIYDRRNVEFLLWEQLDFAKHAGDDREALALTLDAAEALVETHANADAAADAQEPTWDAATGRVSLPASTKAFVDAQRDGGFPLMGAATEDGGLGLSFTAASAVNSVVSCGATSGIAGFYALTHCAANLIKAHGTPQQKDAFLAPLVEGRWTGRPPERTSGRGDVAAATRRIGSRREARRRRGGDVAAATRWRRGESGRGDTPRRRRGGDATTKACGHFEGVSAARGPPPAGTMALSEPHAGSSLSDLYAKAKRVETGRSDEYRLQGQKMWTSGYDHDLSENIVHLARARVGDRGMR